MKAVQNAMWFSYVLVIRIMKHKWHRKNCCPINSTLVSLALLALLRRSCFCCCVHLSRGCSSPFSVPLHCPIKPVLERKVWTQRDLEGLKVFFASCLTLVKPLTVFPAHLPESTVISSLSVICTVQKCQGEVWNACAAIEMTPIEW